MTSSAPSLSVTIPTMAGPSLASTSTVGESNGPTPQAGPLPQKRGEIGFTEGVHVQLAGNANPSQVRLPERHPEDREGPSNENGAAAGHGSSATTTATTTTGTGTTTAANGSPGSPPRNGSPTDGSSTHSKRSFISFLKPKPTPLVAGLHGDTLLRFGLQVGLMVITIAGWVGVAVSIAQNAAQQKSKNGGSGDGFSSASGAASAFVHVAFSIAVLTQLLFLERVIYLLRAERYVHLHPGAILPRTLRLDRARSRGGANTGIPIAPWNRPPLPTYAAALRESGHGTGDVEDGAIAVPPPPAYGATRGSTMLLSGFISNELRAQARAARPESQMSEASGVRPVSYASRDGEWEERRDAGRARRVEEALDRLENGEGRQPSQERAPEPAAASVRG